MPAVERIDTGLPQPADEAAWLAERRRGIGASEASAILGRNPYMSNVDLWEIKTGRRAAADISNNACVRYGHAAEAPIRELFALDHPEYLVQYGGDGRLIEQDTGRTGIYEGKTTEILRSQQLEKWSWTGSDGRRHGRVPDNYYVQLCHQLLATGFEFAVLNCRFRRVYGDGQRAETRSYRFDRDDLLSDLGILLETEVEFWGYVQRDKCPPLVLPDI